MNVGDLKRALEDLDDDLEVRWASQPSWPFEWEISDVQVFDLNQDQEDENAEFEEPSVHENPDSAGDEDGYDYVEPNEIVYLVEGNQIGYLPGYVKKGLGWGR
jgi:hypothetical protein